MRQSWSGRDWLIPYIISFTTTGWWNHAVEVSSDFLNSNDGQGATRWRPSFLFQACTAVVPRSYNNILLVAVDKVGQNNDAETFKIPTVVGNEITIDYGVTENAFVYVCTGSWEY